MIDVENLIDYILSNIKPYPGNRDVAENTSHMVGLIKKFAKESNNGWIPVRGNPPKDIVIGGDEWGNVEKVSYMSNRNGWFIYPRYCVRMDVIVWQPLPEPYQGVEE